jgi:BASS family bile acid:Na+ symporter
MIARWLLLWFLLISAVALWWPWPAYDPFLAIPKAYLPALIGLAMFCIGAMLPRAEVMYVARRWPAVLGGTAVQYASMPLLGYVMARLWRLDHDDFIGLVMVGCVPGAMASNVLTLNARGNASYSVGLTTLATLSSPLIVPLALGLALGRWDSAQVELLTKSAITLLWSVVLPVVLGFVVAQKLPEAQPSFTRWGPAVANLTILWIIAVVIALNRRNLATFDGRVIGALVCVNLLGFVAGYAGAYLLRLDEPMRRALTLEVGMQNAGLGATLALALFPERPAVAIAPALFMFGCMLSGTLLTQAWAWRDGRAKDTQSSAKAV